MDDLLVLLRSAGLQPTPQRLAVARYVLHARCHPTAEDVLVAARQECPTLSRATVYNTLARLAECGLVKPCAIKAGVVIFDGQTSPHHHLVDVDSGEVVDIPWEAVRVAGADGLDEFEVTDVQVVMRGRRR